jgi:cytochrome c-type biogenesis protein
MHDPSVAIVFLAGLVSFLSPCVLPLVPGYLSYMSGLGAAEASVRRSLGTGLAALAFVCGFTAVFVALGATATALGALLAEYRTELSRLGGVVIILMGLVFMGALKAPWLYREARFHPTPRAGLWGSAVLGSAFAFGWTPCIGPILAGILTIAAGEDTVGDGIKLLLVYSAGLAIPFLLTSLAINRFFSAFARIRKHYHKIELASGALLVIIGVLIFTNRFTLIAQYLTPYLPVF